MIQMTFESKIYIIGRAVYRHGRDKLARRIGYPDLQNPNPADVDEIVGRIQSLGQNWRKLKAAIQEHGIVNTGKLVSADSKKLMRRLDYQSLTWIVADLECFESERFWEFARLEAAIVTA